MARQWGNALHFLGMKCSSRHTFAPIDSTCCTSRKYILASGALGGPWSVTANPGEAQLPPLYWSVQIPARLLEAQLPSLYPGMDPVGPGKAQLPVCLIHTGVCTTLVVGFSLTNKNLEYMGLTLKFQWSTLSPTSPFSATPSCCYCSCSE